MIRLSGRRGDDDLGLVTDRTGRVEVRIVTASSRGVRGRHSTSDLPATPNPLAPDFYHGTDALRCPQDSSCSTHGYFHAEYGVSCSVPYVPRTTDSVCEGNMGFEGDRGVGEEQERVQSLHIEGEADERGDDDGDGSDDDQNEGDDAGDEEQLVLVAPVAPASGSDGRPHHGKGKGLTDNFMSVMSKIAWSRNKRPDVAREVPASTQKRKKGGPVDPELIPSYGGHIAGSIWRGQDRGTLKCRSRYMALIGWELTDAQAWIYLYFSIFASPVRPGTETCMPYIQEFPMLGYKNENKLLDICLRLDMMTTDEVRWIPYKTQEIRAR
ncbi:hypothetical protein M9H77_22142 [Catharanthus roseus]|uniref:Uncharacterized protein n=1 Tax=Catharanthus roseus TaxID=4058 RepID=A0ACC0ARN8_CATRO|nr:hypothetical protein M9H77_22142 [Catharanthus roseus]